MIRLTRLSPDTIASRRAQSLDAPTVSSAREIVDAVRRYGVDAVRYYAARFGERSARDTPVLGREAMAAALNRLDEPTREVLERAAARVRAFALAQRASLRDLEAPVTGGHAGHTIEPRRSAGCYAPGGRHPLPSSVLMTAVTARAAGVERVVVCSPNASDVMLASAAIAGADAFLAVGGAHAIAALAYGVEGLEPCDIVVGPGNRWVTAAKQIVSADVAIDMLAGPSELVVIADDSADPATVAADLLAQAEHDTDASAGLIATSEPFVRAVERELAEQLEALPTRATAESSLREHGFSCVVATLDDAAEASDRFAPEHLQLCVRDPRGLARRVRHAGAIFLGEGAAEGFGDYGVGPNHTLPTGGTARRNGGLSVLHFLRVRTWIRMDGSDEGREDVARTPPRWARLEGLEAHARAAEARLARRSAETGAGCVPATSVDDRPAALTQSTTERRSLTETLTPIARAAELAVFFYPSPRSTGAPDRLALLHAPARGADRGRRPARDGGFDWRRLGLPPRARSRILATFAIADGC